MKNNNLNEFLYVGDGETLNFKNNAYYFVDIKDGKLNVFEGLKIGENKEKCLLLYKFNEKILIKLFDNDCVFENIASAYYQLHKIEE
jgi:hypothetical protein